MTSACCKISWDTETTVHANGEQAVRGIAEVSLRVLICGGRRFSDTGFLWKTLDELHAKTPIAEVIVGGAVGADTLAEHWRAREEQAETWADESFLSETPLIAH